MLDKFGNIPEDKRLERKIQAVSDATKDLVAFVIKRNIKPVELRALSSIITSEVSVNFSLGILEMISNDFSRDKRKNVGKAAKAGKRPRKKL